MQRQIVSLHSKPTKFSTLISITFSRSLTTAIARPAVRIYSDQRKSFHNTAKMSAVESKFDPKDMVSSTHPLVPLKASRCV